MLRNGEGPEGQIIQSITLQHRAINALAIIYSCGTGEGIVHVC